MRRCSRIPDSSLEAKTKIVEHGKWMKLFNLIVFSIYSFQSSCFTYDHFRLLCNFAVAFGSSCNSCNSAVISTEYFHIIWIYLNSLKLHSRLLFRFHEFVVWLELLLQIKQFYFVLIWLICSSTLCQFQLEGIQFFFTF